MSCKLCGADHRGWERCKRPPLLEAVSPPSSVEIASVSNAAVSNVQPLSNKAFDKTAYQRQYMREYRAKKKAAK